MYIDKDVYKYFNYFFPIHFVSKIVLDFVLEVTEAA